MDFKIKKFEDLTVNELYAILRLRCQVFVVEQDCVYQDLDGKDQNALHIIGSKNTKIIAYTRVFRSGEYMDLASIGRVVVDENERSLGYGKLIMEKSIHAITSNYKPQPIKISAQVYLKNFYNNLGFKEVGQGYLEDGIPHIAMIRN